METRPAIQETQVRSLGQKDSLEKEMATHFSVLTWRICWTEELDGLYIPWGIRLHIESYTCDKGKLTSVLGEIWRAPLYAAAYGKGWQKYPRYLLPRKKRWSLFYRRENVKWASEYSTAGRVSFLCQCLNKAEKSLLTSMGKDSYPRRKTGLSCLTVVWVRVFMNLVKDSDSWLLHVEDTVSRSAMTIRISCNDEKEIMKPIKR